MRWIRRILVPVGFSRGCRAAYEYARFLATNVGATVDVLHGVSPRTSGVRGEIRGPAGWGEAGGAGLASRVRTFLGAGSDVDVILTDGDVAQTCIAASHWAYDVVVVNGDRATANQIRAAAGCRVVTIWPPPAESPVPFALEPSLWSASVGCGTAAGEAARVAG